VKRKHYFEIADQRKRTKEKIAGAHLWWQVLLPPLLPLIQNLPGPVFGHHSMMTTRLSNETISVDNLNYITEQLFAVNLYFIFGSLVVCTLTTAGNCMTVNGQHKQISEIRFYGHQ
jgi:hypothetical protein